MKRKGRLIQNFMTVVVNLMACVYKDNYSSASFYTVSNLRVGSDSRFQIIILSNGKEHFGLSDRAPTIWLWASRFSWGPVNITTLSLSQIITFSLCGLRFEFGAYYNLQEFVNKIGNFQLLRLTAGNRVLHLWRICVNSREMGYVLNNRIILHIGYGFKMDYSRNALG